MSDLMLKWVYAATGTLLLMACSPNERGDLDSRVQKKEDPDLFYDDAIEPYPFYILHDSKTGCQYIVMDGDGKAVTPRLDVDGKPKCGLPKPE